MEREIEWADNAVLDYHGILEYFEQEGRIHAAHVFAKNIQKKINRALKFPESGRLSNKQSQIRFILINKHYRLFYRFTQTTFFVLAIFDTRQRPEKSPY